MFRDRDALKTALYAAIVYLRTQSVGRRVGIIVAYDGRAANADLAVLVICDGRRSRREIRTINGFITSMWLLGLPEAHEELSRHSTELAQLLASGEIIEDDNEESIKRLKCKSLAILKGRRLFDSQAILDVVASTNWLARAVLIEVDQFRRQAILIKFLARAAQCYAIRTGMWLQDETVDMFEFMSCCPDAVSLLQDRPASEIEELVARVYQKATGWAISVGVSLSAPAIIRSPRKGFSQPLVEAMC